ncbi:tubulin-like doman-containing protein [Natronoglomus mannanivorans]|uniref:Tubulin like n=1 Tax=Natronoglomus mannanivorans TaxID=2979990 RepID=A0AAP2Z4F0_9EURY|nr:hypothetical protein [Halobacteria archaeon AArc-xg1-1]
MNERKHIVISVGTSGFRTAKTLNRLVRKHGLEEQFKFVTFETAALSDSTVPPTFETVELRRDDAAGQRFEQWKSDVPWLDEDLDLAKQGATSKPPIGRFLLEYYHDQVDNSIDQLLREFVDPVETDELSAWLVGALSGGTAAGMLPLLSVILSDIMDDFGDEHDIEARIAATATLSKFESRRRRTTLGPIPSYFVNTNISLRQFATLLNVPDATGRRPNPYPLTIQMDTAPDSQVRCQEFTVEEPPLDALFLLPIDEERMNAASFAEDEFENYREQVNWALSNAILSVTQAADGIENIFTRKLKDRILTVSTTGVRVPIDEAFTYFDRVDDIESLDEELEAARKRQTELRQTVDALEQSIAVEDDVAVPDPIVSLSQPVASVTDRIRETVDSLPLTSTSTDELRAHARRIAGRLNESEGPIPHETLATAVFYRVAASRVEDTLQTHEFEATVEEFWAKNEETLSDRAPSAADADAVRKYERGVRPVLQEKRAAIEERREQIRTIRVRKRKRLQEDLDAVESRLAEIEHLYDEYTSLQQLRDELDEQLLPDVRLEFEQHVDSLEVKLESIKSDIQELRSHRQDKRAELEAARTRLEGARQNSIRMLPLNTNSLEDVSRRTLEDAGTIGDLVDSGVVDRDALVDALRLALRKHLDEPIEDYMHDALSNRSQGKLALLTHDENQNVLSLSASTGQDVSTVLASQDIDSKLSVSGVDAPFTVTLIALYEDVYLDNTSEYRRITELWERGELADLFGEEVAFDRNIAYPQLYLGGGRAPEPEQHTNTGVGGE